MTVPAYEYLRILIAAPWDAGDEEYQGGKRKRAGRHALRLESSVPPSTTSADDDAVLVARLRAGDESALVDIIRSQTGLLTRCARVLVRSDAAADDVVQDVFVALWEQREGLQLRGALRHYLVGAVRHRALNVIRAERSRTRTAESAGHVFGEPLMARNDALSHLAVEEIVAVVEHALLNAAPQCRTIFLLSWRAGLEYAEIAQQLGISMRTVYNQMYRATKLVAAAVDGMRRE